MLQQSLAHALLNCGRIQGLSLQSIISICVVAAGGWGLISACLAVCPSSVDALEITKAPRLNCVEKGLNGQLLLTEKRL